MDLNRINFLIFLLALIALCFAVWGFLHKEQGAVAVASIIVSLASVAVAWSGYLDSKSQRQIEALRRRAVLMEDIEAQFHGQSELRWGLSLRFRNIGSNPAESVKFTTFTANHDFEIQTEEIRSHGNMVAPNGTILFSTHVMDFSGLVPNVKYVGIAIEYLDTILEKRFRQFIALRFDTRLAEPWKNPLVCSIDERDNFLNALKVHKRFNIADSD